MALQRKRSQGRMGHMIIIYNIYFVSFHFIGNNFNLSLLLLLWMYTLDLN